MMYPGGMMAPGVGVGGAYPQYGMQAAGMGMAAGYPTALGAQVRMSDMWRFLSTWPFLIPLTPSLPSLGTPFEHTLNFRVQHCVCVCVLCASFFRAV